MNVEQQVEKLQGLLERVQQNAARPRPPMAVAAPPPAAATPPPAVVAPAVVAPPVEEPAVEEAVEDIDLLDEDIIDLTAEEVGAEEVEAAAVVPTGPELEEDIFFEDEEEIEPPASSRRPKVAASMDEALAGAAELEMDQGREVPLKTPPPESGRQVATPPSQGLQQPAPPADLGAEVDELLEADISSGTQHARPAGPTPEQLGQTIDLEEAGGEPLELEAPAAPTPAPARSEELEAPLPPREAFGSYTDGLVPPPEAHAELEARRRRDAEPVAEPSAADVKPDVVKRPAITASGPAAEFVAAARDFKPESFQQLLDASLSLGK